MAYNPTIRNFNRAAQRLEQMKRGIGEAVPSGLRMIAEEILTDVKTSRPRAGVPRDTGVLAGTGRVTGPNPVGEVEMSFGGASAPYALIQHEDFTLYHTVGEAQYMTRGVQRWRRGGVSVQRAFAEVQKAIKRLERGRRL